MLVRLVEDQTRGEGEDVDPLRFATELYNDVGFLEVGRSETEPTETELFQRRNDA